jgi:hypothetical protein
MQPEYNTLLLLPFILLTAFAAAYFAKLKGRDPILWFVIGFLFTIPALILLYLLPDSNESDVTMTVSEPDPSLTPSPTKVIERLPDENKLWYYLDQEHEQMGPVSVVALRDLWNTGLLEPGSLVWTEGMSKWETIEELPELREILNKS